MKNTVWLQLRLNVFKVSSTFVTIKKFAESALTDGICVLLKFSFVEFSKIIISFGYRRDSELSYSFELLIELKINVFFYEKSCLAIKRCNKSKVLFTAKVV